MSAAETPSRTGATLLGVVVFLASFAIMCLELAASRLFTPYFGSSIFVWGTLISVILLALSVGYAVGGRAADRYPPRTLLAGLLLGAGLLVAAADLVAPWLLSQAAPLGIVWGTLLVTVLLFLVPMGALGAMTPAVLKLRIDSTETVGRTSGDVFFLSSLGSILGTGATTFLLVPFLGTTFTIALVAVILTGLGVLVLPRRRLPALLLVVPPALLALHAPPLVAAEDGLLFEAESPYQYVRVVEREGKRFLLLNRDRPFESFNSIVGPELLTGFYFDDMAIAPALVPNARRALVLGMGAGTVVGQMHALYPDLVIDAVEIDPVVVDVARRFFGLPDGPRVRVHTEEGRTFLEAATEPWDVILVDVFQNGPYVPFHFATREFYALLAARLAPGGVLVTNVEIVEAPLLNAIASALPNVLTVRRTGNVVTFASARPITLPAPDAPAVPPALRALVARATAEGRPYVGAPAPLFTDDRAPVELLIALEVM